MQIPSNEKRNLWLSSLSGLIPDLVIACVISWMFSGSIEIFFIAFISLQILYILIWIKNSIWSWILYILNGRKKLTEHLCDFLMDNKFPVPEQRHISIIPYFESIVANDNAPVNLRILAAAEVGAFKMLGNQFQIQVMFRISTAYQDALDTYRKNNLQQIK